MLRVFLAASAIGQCMAMRPEVHRARLSRDISEVGALISKISSPKESLSALQAASRIVDEILLQAGNATEHMSSDDMALLNSVVTLVQTTIYGSMESAHNADATSLDAGVGVAGACNSDIAFRQSAEGDLGTLQGHTTEKQTELDRLQGVVDEKTLANNTEWAAFDLHMQLISDPPACPEFPARTKAALDVYFEVSPYSVWYTAQQDAYTPLRDAYVAADAALTGAINDFNIQKAVRDTQFCDWKQELESACTGFDTCFSQASATYTDVTVPRVTGDMNSRIEAYKAGETLVHQIKFLLAEEESQETPPIDTARFELTFPALPPKGLCDLTPLDDAIWVPTPSCESSGPGKP